MSAQHFWEGGEEVYIYIHIYIYIQVFVTGVNGTLDGALLEMMLAGVEEQRMTAKSVGPAGRSPALWPFGSRSLALIRHGNLSNTPKIT